MSSSISSAELEVRDTHSQAVLERIAQDRERVDKQQEAHPRVCMMLRILETELFNPDCNVNFLKLQVGVRDNSIVTRFHEQLGAGPKAYLTQRRMGVAAELVKHTRLKMWQIARLVGYSSDSPFGNAFRKWAGVSASAYRKQHTALAGGAR